MKNNVWQVPVIGLVAMLMAGGASAGTVNDIGPTVHRALEMQRSGRESVETRPILKDVAGRTYERYLESFTYPIPEQFDRDESFSAGGGGS